MLRERVLHFYTFAQLRKRGSFFFCCCLIPVLEDAEHLDIRYQAEPSNEVEWVKCEFL